MVLAIILALVPYRTSAQDDWQWTGNTDSERGHVADIIEIGSGYMALVQADPNTLKVLRFTLAGAVEDVQHLWYGNNHIGGQEIYFNASTLSFHVIAGTYDTLNNNGHGIVHFTAGQDMSFQVQAHILINEDSMRIRVASGCWDDEGHLFLPLYATEPPGASTFNRLGLVKLSTDGELLSFKKHGSSGFNWPRHALFISTDSVLVSVTGGMSINPSGFSNFIYFNTDLNLTGAFPASNVMNNGPPGQYNVLFNGMYMQKLNESSFVCSGQYSSISQGMRAAAVRYGFDGSHEAQFLPASGFDQDFCAIIQGHTLMPDGEIVHAYVENFYPFSSNIQMGPDPSRIRIHRLDSMLNPLCDMVIDGFEDNAYYYLMRIKATSDGGVLVMGSRRDLNTLGLPDLWVRKIAPNDCLTSIAEPHTVEQEAAVFPNPSTNGFTLHVQGPVVPSGMVHLHDMQGRLVRSVRLHSSYAYMPAEDLASGLYLYRVVDAHGRAVASGKWVKE